MTCLRIALLGFFVFFSTSSPLLGYVASGEEAPNFTINDIHGQEISLETYRGKIVVLEWTAPRCPYVLKHYSKGNLPSMQLRWAAPLGEVVWIMIDSTSPDDERHLSPEGWKAQLVQWGAHPTALIFDDEAQIASEYGVQRVPEVFIIDKGGQVAYRGAVDSLRGTDPKEIEDESNLAWLKNALENAVQGRRIDPSETIPYGCPVR